MEALLGLVGAAVMGKDELCDGCEPVIGAEVVAGWVDALTDVLPLEDGIDEDESVDDDSMRESETEDGSLTLEADCEEGSANDKILKVNQDQRATDEDNILSNVEQDRLPMVAELSPGVVTLWLVPEISAAIQGDRPHSKPPFRTTLLYGVGVHVGVVDVVDDVVLVVDVVVEVAEVVVVDEVLEVEESVELIVGLHEQAELYREAAVPQAADALLGKPVVIVLTAVVKVAQKAASDEYAAGL
ncbi:MAG: hypothetical protein Q9202_006445 [Teloschistes flavicans]